VEELVVALIFLFPGCPEQDMELSWKPGFSLRTKQGTEEFLCQAKLPPMRQGARIPISPVGERCRGVPRGARVLSPQKGSLLGQAQAFSCSRLRGTCRPKLATLQRWEIEKALAACDHDLALQRFLDEQPNTSP